MLQILEARGLRLGAALIPLALAGCGQLTGGQTTAAAAAASGSPAIDLGETGFIDRFERLDESHWEISDGWSNGDWVASDFQREQVALVDGKLSFTLGPALGEDKPWSGAEFREPGRRHYGYFEIDMRVPRGSGIVSGFFTYTGSYFGDPHDEIDIEILGKNTREVMLTTFKNGEQNTTYVPLGFDAADEFHLYAFEWTKDYVRWYVDGKPVHEVPEAQVPHTPQIYYLNLWNSDTLTDWVGPIDAASAPWVMGVACMAYAESYPGRPVCREP